VHGGKRANQNFAKTRTLLSLGNLVQSNPSDSRENAHLRSLELQSRVSKSFDGCWTPLI